MKKVPKMMHLAAILFLLVPVLMTLLAVSGSAMPAVPVLDTACIACPPLLAAALGVPEENVI